jgi:hypothetical protein
LSPAEIGALFLSKEVSAIESAAATAAANNDLKKRVVVSYKTEDKAMLKTVRDLIQSWGFEPWDGSQVVAADEWITEWREMVEGMLYMNAVLEIEEHKLFQPLPLRR